MSLHILPQSAPVGAVVEGFRPDLPADEASKLYRAFLEYGVLIFSDIELDVSVHMALGRLFGEPDEPHPLEELRHEDEPHLTVLSANGGKPVAADDPDADKRIGTIPWHADRLYTDTPNRGALLRAVVIPEAEGQTGWIDMARAYRTLPEKVKARLQGLRIVHSYATSHRRQNMVGGTADALPDSAHPLVFVHPETDMPLLNIGPATAKEIIGLPQAEGEELLDYLITHATREEDAYIHDWKPGDLVAWDNYRAIHRAFGHAKRYPRVMHSLALKGKMKLGETIKAGTRAGTVTPT